MTTDSSLQGPITTEGSSMPLADPSIPGRSNWWKVHAWPLSGMLIMLVAGMAYSFFWYPIVDHISIWNTPGDLWGTFRDAHYIIWDGEGQVYNASTNFVTFPGIAILLAPFAALQEAFHLTESWPVYLYRPSAWFLLGPVDILCGGIMLFPLDAIARRIPISAGRRALATVLELVLVFPVVAFWGHPEDTLSIALGLYGLLAAYDRRWLHSAAFFALAIIFQPLILLIVPIAFAYVPFRRWFTFAVVMSVPSALLLIPPFIQERAPTIYAIFKQPNYPTIDHPTPWLSLAPVLTKAGWGYEYTVHLSKATHKFEWGPIRVFVGETVAAGPGRTIALVLACLVGVWIARAKPPLVEVVWWAAFALALRCIFESVMDPYYLVPTLVLIIVTASTVGKIRFLFVLIAVGICTWTSYWHVGEWDYYLWVTLSLLLALACAWPRTLGQKRPLEPSTGVREPVKV